MSLRKKTLDLIKKRAEALQGSVLRDFEARGVHTLSLPPELLAELDPFHRP